MYIRFSSEVLYAVFLFYLILLLGAGFHISPPRMRTSFAYNPIDFFISFCSTSFVLFGFDIGTTVFSLMSVSSLVGSSSCAVSQGFLGSGSCRGLNPRLFWNRLLGSYSSRSS